jgi:hypothetical protein
MACCWFRGQQASFVSKGNRPTDRLFEPGMEAQLGDARDLACQGDRPDVLMPCDESELPFDSCAQ